MRARFLIPGDGDSQLRALPAVAATAEQLHFQIQVACPPAAAGVWSLLPAVEKVIPFPFGSATMADWANLLGSVREPDFQVCINLASGRQVDLMLSMSHIPARIAAGGFSATQTVTPLAGWPSQALASYLLPIGVRLDAGAYRLPLAAKDLAGATAGLPAGDGPMLLLARGEGSNDWPADRWQALPQRLRTSVPGVRSLDVAPTTTTTAAAVRERAALVAVSDVVLASDPVTIELALLCGVPLVALGRPSSSLPQRSGVQGMDASPGLGAIALDDVLRALGLG
jgi:hypothetical protein